jgi:hypothetical protein
LSFAGLILSTKLEARLIFPTPFFCCPRWTPFQVAIFVSVFQPLDSIFKLPDLSAHLPLLIFPGQVAA